MFDFFLLSVPLMALCLDLLLGEPRRWHPLVGFGLLAERTEALLNRQEAKYAQRSLGVLAWSLLVLPLPLLLLFLPDTLYGGLIEVCLLYLAVGRRSLVEHALAVKSALECSGVQAGREKVSWMVSRQTDSLSEGQVVKATLESVLENGNDALFGVLFCYLVAGAPGVVLFRLANTLDAMWGYRTPRLLHFGWAAARLDDVLNYPSARLTALSYALLGRTRWGLRCWKTQAALCDSPNGGVVMSSGAGSLGVLLGGGGYYHGQWQDKPILGCGREPRREDILAVVVLFNRATLLWLFCMTLFIFLFQI
ncbi:MAG: CobD/CbiB family cobalamin biosynthesis protein [Gammaproteobacteria bacterium]|nr:CobD/CbiB family cobalamin biosynthesis protein [Gammaproteobacteria bacterium]